MPTVYLALLIALVGCSSPSSGNARPEPAPSQAPQPPPQPPPLEATRAQEAPVQESRAHSQGAAELTSSENQQVGAEAPTLTVVSYNILYQNLDLKEVVGSIAEADADIVFLQETNDESARYLKKHLGGAYPHSHFTSSSQGWRAGGLGFLSKRPLRKIQFLPPEHGAFGSLVAEAEVEGQSLQLVNLHLDPIRLSGSSTWKRVVSAIEVMEKNHEQEVRALASWLDASVATIVAGDFNSTSQQVVGRYLRERGFIDAIAEVVENAELIPTWRWPWQGKEIGFRIDHIFHSPHFRPTAGEIRRTHASDHDLVLARIAWSEVARVDASPTRR